MIVLDVLGYFKRNKQNSYAVLIRNIAEYLNQKGKSAALLSMAFDRVSHVFLF